MALAMLRAEDSLTVQALQTYAGQPLPSVKEYRVIRDLPDPAPPGPGPSRIEVARSIRNAAQRARARRRVLRAESFDVAHLQLLTYEVDAIEFLLPLGSAVRLTTIHDVYPHARSRFRSAERLALRHTYRRAGHLLVYSTTLRDELLDDFGLSPSKVHVLPIPLSPVPPRYVTAPTGGPIRSLLFFGSLRRNKGLPVLLEAASALSGNVDFELTIAGAGDPSMIEFVSNYAKRLPELRFHPGKASMELKHRLFAACDMVVLPYEDFHSQSGVVADAYSYRRPLLVSDVGALGDTVRMDRTGLVTPRGSVNDLCEAIERACAMDRTSFSRALEEAAATHHPRAVGPKLREIYASIVDAADG